MGSRNDAFSPDENEVAPTPASLSGETMPEREIPSPEPFFTRGQRKMVATAIACLAFALIGALIIGGVRLLGIVVSTFSGVLWPLAVAGIVALMLRPVVERIEHRLRGRRLAAVLIVVGIMALVLAVILLILMPPAIRQILDLIAFVPAMWQNSVAYLELHYPSWVELTEKQLQNPTIKSIVDQATQELQSLFKHAVPSLKAAGSGLMGIVGFITHLAVVPIYLFFFLLSRVQPADKLPEHLPFLSPTVRGDVVFLVREFVSIIVSFFRGQLLIGMIMGVLYAIGFSIVGLKFGAVVGLMLGFLNIIPYLGSIIGLVICIPLALFQPDGGGRLVLLMLAVQAVVQNIEGWFLTPKIMSDRTGLHPVAVIIAIFFWGTALDGLLGMVLAIPLTAFFVTAWRLAKRKYLGNRSGLRGLERA
ncbi:MAG TPA: AI-2E family transporter [Opitutaceae bacterium]|nr:AI-2E family transporter [Opitutaceae bacterium]